jgi:germination protein M
MSKTRKSPMLLSALLLLVCLGSFVACSRDKETVPAAAKPARISATKAFETYFGPAPTTEKGTCYGFVIYFPSAANPQKVAPFPFFSFDEASLKRIALERLIGGMDEKSYAGEFLQVFPKGSRLLSLAESGGVISADFSGEIKTVAASKTSGPGLFNAVTLTLMQFNGVKGVRILSGGSEVYSTGKEPAPGQSAVLQPSAPRLLNVVAMKETAASPVGEVDALFDRPVNIGEFTFSFPDGTRIAGDIFHSMFDMAAVLKPKEASRLTPGMQMKVHWKVTDKVGREGAGDQVFPLEVKIHQD